MKDTAPGPSVEQQETLVSDAVQGALTALGESAMPAVIYLLEKRYEMKLGDIPRNPEGFCRALREIFGYGANVITELLIDALGSKAAGAGGDGALVGRFVAVLVDTRRSISSGIE